MSLWREIEVSLVIVAREEKEEKKKQTTDLRFNCLQISHGDCCSFLYLTGFYLKIQKGWNLKKKTKKKRNKCN